jgi:hypothetical protein
VSVVNYCNARRPSRDFGCLDLEALSMMLSHDEMLSTPIYRGFNQKASLFSSTPFHVTYVI